MNFAVFLLAGSVAARPAKLVAVAPVLNRVVHGLRAIGAVRQRDLAVVDLAARAVLLDIVPTAQRIFVLDLHGFVAGELDCPVRAVLFRSKEFSKKFETFAP